jgi:hypothetical protein
MITSSLSTSGLKNLGAIPTNLGMPSFLYHMIIDSTLDFDRRKVKEMSVYDYLVLDVSLFWFATKHKGKFQGIDELIKWLHWIYDFT